MLPGDFNSLVQPVYLKDDGGRLLAGFRVEKHHANPSGTCHGGMLATFCDVHMPWSVIYQDKMAVRLLPTISLSLDYMLPVPLGAWVEGRVEVLKTGRQLIFAQELLTVDGRIAVRANGCFSRPAPAEDVDNLHEAVRKTLTGQA